MLQLIAAARSWHTLVRIGVAALAVAAATALQLPHDIVVPGEPFLLHFIVVAAAAVFLGRAPGFFAAAATSLASALYFEPLFTLKLHHAVDLLVIEAYAIAAAASVEALSRLVDSALAERTHAREARFQHREAQTRLTAAERMARSLAESEARFRATFENAAVGISHFGSDGRWLRANDALCRILGWPADELFARSFQDITHPDDLPAELADLEQLRAGKIASYSVDKRSLRKDGEIVWIRRTVSCVRGDDGAVAYFVSVVEDISDRKQAEEQIQFLMREANHRVKNMLGLVQAIARQTAAGSPERFMERFTERLQALAANQDLLVSNKWHGVEVERLLRAQLAPFADLFGTRITSSGPPLRLNAAAAQAIGLALHELATNAGKYGALSTDSGRIDIAWRTENAAFVISWAERGGPPVRPPEHRGFGGMVTEAMAKHALDGDVALEYAPTGLKWRLSCPAVNALERAATKAGGVDQ